jgi:hypothetical protein
VFIRFRLQLENSRAGVNMVARASGANSALLSSSPQKVTTKTFAKFAIRRPFIAGQFGFKQRDSSRAMPIFRHANARAINRGTPNSQRDPLPIVPPLDIEGRGW